VIICVSRDFDSGIFCTRLFETQKGYIRVDHAVDRSLLSSEVVAVRMYVVSGFLLVRFA